ncbi:response regulator [Zoogloea sp.]|uniref:response regulator n=1 Tax=Zoogloea sp. TaxID=49181 RepID=UPI0035B26F92
MIDFAHISALIVEANPNMRTQLRNMLNASGISKVDFAVSASAAVRKLRDSKPELILSEYHLGDGQDGQHLLEDLRTHHIISLSTLFIMVTGERHSERVLGACELAPNDYILKPFTADTLHDRIARALEKRIALLPTHKLIEMGNISDAIASSQQGEERYPHWALDFIRLRAELHLHSGNAQEAHKIYQQIIKARNLPWARLGLAKAEYFLRRYDTATQQLETLIAENERFIDAYDWLARSRQAAGNLEGAHVALKTAAQLSPHRLLRLRQLGELSMETGDTAGAEKVLGEVVRKGKSSDFRDPEDHVRLIQAQLAQGSTPQAEQTLRDLERSMGGLDKTKACSQLSNVLLHVSKGDLTKAVAAIEALTGEQKNTSGLSLGLKQELARACFNAQMEDKGAEVIMDILRNAPDERAVEDAKNLLKDIGKGELGESMAQKIQEEVRSLVAEGAQKAQDGDLEGAVKFMLVAVERMPGNLSVLFNAALAILKFLEASQWNAPLAQQVRDLMDKARDIDPGNERLSALTTYYDRLLKKYHVQPRAQG